MLVFSSYAKHPRFLHYIHIGPKQPVLHPKCTQNLDPLASWFDIPFTVGPSLRASHQKRDRNLCELFDGARVEIVSQRHGPQADRTHLVRLSLESISCCLTAICISSSNASTRLTQRSSFLSSNAP